MTAGDQRVVPNQIKAVLQQRIRRTLEATSKANDGATCEIPEALTLGVVRTIFSGGPFGWQLKARLDEVDGRLSLEALECDRMSGYSRYRVWEDGETDHSLPAPSDVYMVPGDATTEERRRLADEHRAEYQRAYDELKARGFMT